jgi:formylglycine-generating enzyme
MPVHDHHLSPSVVAPGTFRDIQIDSVRGWILEPGEAVNRIISTRIISILIMTACAVSARNPNAITNTAIDGMALVPAGWFVMGRDNGGLDERPEHRVYVDAFYMAETEVTIWEYLACVHAGQCRMPDWWNRNYFEEPPVGKGVTEWLLFPVTGVSWNDAMDYCRWKGGGFRLPTEAEWEYACRAGTRTTYFWGDDFKEAGTFANVGPDLGPVGLRKPNPWGLFDMIGNVWEWCLDCYSDRYYRISPDRNPMGPDCEASAAKHAARGGSWNEYSWNLRCANRSFGEADKGYKGLGFRIVLPVNDCPIRPDSTEAR